jgi:DNA-binding NarL/FixJ family response regulator
MANDSEKPIRIALVESLALVRAGIRSLIAEEPGMELVGEAGDFDTAIRIVSTRHPDIILLELNQAANLGLADIPRLLQAGNHTRIILVTRSTDPNTYIQAFQNGVLGVVLKTHPPEALIKAIRKVHSGEAWIERSMVAHLLNNMTQSHPATPSKAEVESIAILSQREREIVQYVGQGMNTRDIAAQLYISETTVRHYLTSIYEKLGVSGRLELLIYAYRVGMITPMNGI